MDVVEPVSKHILHIIHIKLSHFKWKSEFHWWSRRRIKAENHIIEKVKLDLNFWSHQTQLTCSFVFSCTVLMESRLLKIKVRVLFWYSELDSRRLDSRAPLFYFTYIHILHFRFPAHNHKWVYEHPNYWRHPVLGVWCPRKGNTPQFCLLKRAHGLCLPAVWPTGVSASVSLLLLPPM